MEVIKDKVHSGGLWRDLTAFWIFGLCNNFGYIVMLTAAHDIIADLAENDVSCNDKLKLLLVKLFFLRFRLKSK